MDERRTAVFETEQTLRSWDEDYYPPAALRYYDRAVPRMLERMGAKPGEAILDAGCGTGVHAIRCARAGLDVTAIDVSSTMIGEARRRVEAAGLSERVSFAQEDVSALSFADESFRLVFSWGVIIHVPALERALDELARVLKPGGRLALYVTNRSAMDHKLEDGLRLLLRKPHERRDHRELGDELWHTMHGEPLLTWRLDARAVTGHLRRHGMRLEHRGIGELTEIQRRIGGLPRRALLLLNDAAHRLHLPAGPAVTQLLVFAKD